MRYDRLAYPPPNQNKNPIFPRHDVQNSVNVQIATPEPYRMMGFLFLQMTDPKQRNERENTLDLLGGGVGLWKFARHTRELAEQFLYASRHTDIYIPAPLIIIQ